jgi:cytochrome c-type biogenesis protein
VKARTALPSTGAAAAALVAVAAPAAALDPSNLTLPTVVGAGLLDGFMPCSFALLLLFVSYTVTQVKTKAEAAGREANVRETRMRLLLVGGVFILGIYLAYFALGLGFLGTVAWLQQSHLIGKVAAVLVILVGFLALLPLAYPEFPFSLAMPSSLHRFAEGRLKAATVPAAFAGGVLIALCAVPCSGTVYLGVLALISATSTAWTGVGYLALYNLMFVAPLLVVLALAANRRSFNRIAHFRHAHHDAMNGMMGTMMVGLGMLTLLFLS